MRVFSSLALSLLAAGFMAAPSAVFADEVVVAVDHAVRLPLQGDAASVVIGNHMVADVDVVDSRTVFLSGKGVGFTNIVVLDAAGRTVFSSDVSVTNPGAGHVSVYRGVQRTQLACAPSCAPYAHGGASGDAAAPAGGDGAAPAPPPQN